MASNSFLKVQTLENKIFEIECSERSTLLPIIILLRLIIEERYKDLKRWEVFNFLDRNYDNWLKCPENFSDEMCNSMQMFLLYKKLNDRYNCDKIA